MYRTALVRFIVILGVNDISLVGGVNLRANAYPDYKPSTALQYASYGQSTTDPANSMSLGETYSKASGFGYSEAGTGTGGKEPVFIGSPPKDSPSATIGLINQLMHSTGMQACDVDLNSIECKNARPLLEQKMFDVLVSLGYTTPASFANLIDLFKKLDLAERQVRVMNHTVSGTKSEKGLVQLMDLINQELTQFETRIDGAYGNVMDVMGQRRDLLTSEGKRLTDLNQQGVSKLKDVSRKVIISNTGKAARSLAAVMSDAGKALGDVGKQASDMSDYWSSGLAELDARYTDWMNETDTSMDQGSRLIDIEKEDAKMLAKTMNVTMKISSQQLEMAAKSKQRDWIAIGDRIMKSAYDKEQKAMTGKLEAVMATVNVTQGNLNQQLAAQAFNLYPQIEGVKSLADSLSPAGLKQLKNVMDQSIDEASSLAKNGDFKATYLSQHVEELAKLVSDEASQAAAQKQLAVDSLNALSVQYNSALSSASSEANADAAKMKSDVSSSVAKYGENLGSLSAQGAAQAAQFLDSAAAKSADLQAQAGTGTLTGADGLGAAADAAATGSKLAAAQLQSVADTAASVVGTQASVMSAALIDGRDTVGEIASAGSSETTAMSRQLLNQLAASTAAIQQAGSLPDLAGLTSGDIAASQQTVSGTTSDAKAALTSVSNYQDIVGQRASAIQTEMLDTQRSINSSLEQLSSAIPSSQEMLASSIGAASSYLQSGLATGLGQEMREFGLEVSRLNNSVDADVSEATNVVSMALSDAQDEIQDIVKGNTDMVSKANVVLDQLASPNVALASGGGVKALLGATQNEAYVKFMRRLKAVKTEFVNKMNAVERNSAQLADSKVNSTISALAKAAGDLSAILHDHDSVVSGLTDLKDEILANISNSVGQSQREFEKFNQRTNATKWGLGATGTNSANLLLNTRTNISDMMARITAALNNEVAHIDSVNRNASVDSLSRIELAIEAVQNAPKRSSLFVGNVSEDVTDFQSQIDDEAESFHQKTLHTLRSASTVIGDIQTAVDEELLKDSLHLTDSQKDIFNVLLGLTNSLGSSSKDGDSLWSQAQAELDSHRAGVATQLAAIANRMDKQYKKLEMLAAQKQLGLNKKLNEFIQKLKLDLGGSDANLTATQEMFTNALNGKSGGWTNNAKQAYSIAGLLKNLSMKNKGRLQGLLELVASGQLTFQDALAQARMVDINDIKSTSDATGLLIGAMVQYQQDLYRAFGDSGERLDNVTAKINTYIDSNAPATLMNLETVHGAVTNTSDELSDFNSQTDGVLQGNSDQVAQLQNMIEQNRTAINMMLGELKNEVDQIEGDMKSNQLEYENWIDSVIAEELKKAQTKAFDLKQKLNITEAPPSFLQRHSRAKRPSFTALELELDEIQRRKQMHRAHGHQVETGF